MGAASASNQKQMENMAQSQNQSNQAVNEKPWFCTECGAKNTSGKFCGECGTKRAAAPGCSSCGYVPVDGTSPKFCPECGNKF